MTLKREISRTMNFRFPYVNQFVKRCENLSENNAIFHKITKQKDGNIQPGSFVGVLSLFSYVKLKVARLFLIVPS